jgi:hypothetical protein
MKLYEVTLQGYFGKKNANVLPVNVQARNKTEAEQLAMDYVYSNPSGFFVKAVGCKVLEAE